MTLGHYHRDQPPTFVRNLRLRFGDEKGLEGIEAESWVRIENKEIVQRVG